MEPKSNQERHGVSTEQKALKVKTLEAASPVSQCSNLCIDFCFLFSPHHFLIVRYEFEALAIIHLWNNKPIKLKWLKPCNYFWNSWLMYCVIFASLLNFQFFFILQTVHSIINARIHSRKCSVFKEEEKESHVKFS